MLFPIRRILQTIIFNSTLFMILMVGIQNSSTKRKVNYIASETINMPISFIVGISFISGSITATILSENLINKK